MLTGGALVVAGMAISHRPEAIAVSSLPKADDLSAVFRQVAADAIPSIVAIESTTKPRQMDDASRTFAATAQPLFLVGCWASLLRNIFVFIKPLGGLRNLRQDGPAF